MSEESGFPLGTHLGNSFVLLIAALSDKEGLSFHHPLSNGDLSCLPSDLFHGSLLLLTSLLKQPCFLFHGSFLLLVHFSTHLEFPGLLLLSPLTKSLRLLSLSSQDLNSLFLVVLNSSLVLSLNLLSELHRKSALLCFSDLSSLQLLLSQLLDALFLKSHSFLCLDSACSHDSLLFDKLCSSLSVSLLSGSKASKLLPSAQLFPLSDLISAFSFVFCS